MLHPKPRADAPPKGLVLPAGSPAPFAANTDRDFRRIRSTTALLNLVQLFVRKFATACAAKGSANFRPAALVAWRRVLTLSLFSLALSALTIIGGVAVPVRAEPQSYSFGVLSQRSAVLTAQYWNPILDYIGPKAGVTCNSRSPTPPRMQRSHSQGRIRLRLFEHHL